ncbi:glycosyltransferase family 4 protein [Devosia sp.]|uniref:glycosyltransferase family 4 protein n=1 Tax=Devosia sp. TaxID=1871048 RepID=UPI00273526F6|nr:glycosyltransferase family 4 protein [Devosia sp.]MDP2782159.1 glycosyltransferase family 4 protein [Devosia sp.]
MRLLIVSQYFWPENFRINDLVKEMVERGHDVTVLTGIPNYPEGRVNPAFCAEPHRFSEWAGARIVRVPMLARGQGTLRLLLNYLSFVVSASMLGTWKLRGQNFDAIFVYQLSPVTSALPAVLLRAIKQAPIAMWVLDLWPETLSAVGVVRSKWVLAAVGRLVGFIYRRCDLILAQSKSFVSAIKRYADAGQQVEYFPSWAESVFDGAEVEPAPEVPVVSDSFNVMFAGNIGDAQDFPSILKAAELLRDQHSISWLIVGDGRTAGWVTAEIERRNLAERVIMLGRFPLERMPAFFQHADALLVSLKDEPIFALTIPGKVQSYLATGIPLIAMLNGEGAKVIFESGSGLVCPAGDAEGLARSVLALSRMSREQRQEMGLLAKRAYSREFDREVLMDRLEYWLLSLEMKSGRATT